MSHYKLNPPPFVPDPRIPQFFGTPDGNGAIYTRECYQADAVIHAFGRQGPQQAAYVAGFFDGEPATGTPAASRVNQIGDMPSYFPDMGSDARAALNIGTNHDRAEFLAGTVVAPGLDAAGVPVAGCGAYSDTLVSVSEVGSEYNARCASFQRNLNSGIHGGGNTEGSGHASGAAQAHGAAGTSDG